MPSAKPLPIAAVIPVLNCRPDLPAHLESIAPWLDSIEEVIVVDSFSEDGSLEFLTRHLRHPKVSFLSHPRGLYQSWNHAIDHVRAKYFLVSTIGDSTTLESLRLMLETAESLVADVTLGVPEMRAPDGSDPGVCWPLHHFASCHPADTASLIAPWEWMAWCLARPPETLMGSSASNLYRSAFMRPRPFATGYGRGGDSAWALTHAFQGRFAFEPRAKSEFLVHPPLPSARSARLWMEDYCHLLGEAIDKGVAENGPMPEPCAALYREFSRLRRHLVLRECLAMRRAELAESSAALAGLRAAWFRLRSRPSRKAIRRHACRAFGLLARSARQPTPPTS